MLICTPDEFMSATPMERRKLVVGQIDLTPHLHDQAAFQYKARCGTTRCVAGWAVALAGYDLRRSLEVYNGDNDMIGDVTDVAAVLLGLEETDATRIFYGCSNRDSAVDALMEAPVL